MNKYDNYIYMTICEVSYDLFKKTNFVTYSNYCKWFYTNLNDESINYGYIPNVIKSNISDISEVLDDLFNIDIEVSCSYIYDYFHKEKYLIFEKVVVLNREYYPSSDYIK